MAEVAAEAERRVACIVSRGIAVLILSFVGLLCTAAIVLAFRPELLVMIALMFGGAS